MEGDNGETRHVLSAKMSACLNLRLDFFYRELNGFKTLDTHFMMLETQVFQIAEAMLQEKLQDGDFQVESYMSVGSSHCCRSTPSTEHRSTPFGESVGSSEKVRCIGVGNISMTPLF